MNLDYNLLISVEIWSYLYEVSVIFRRFYFSFENTMITCLYNFWGNSSELCPYNMFFPKDL